MKNLRKNPKYKQGIYNAQHPEKYKGSIPIIYRSGLEIKAFRWMDNNSNVLTWGSESVVVPYQGPDGKIHRYFIDLVCEMRRTDGSNQKFLIEVKPERQTMAPIITPRKAKKTIMYESYTWAVNNAKWQAAEQYAKQKGYKFIILTDKHLTV